MTNELILYLIKKLLLYISSNLEKKEEGERR